MVHILLISWASQIITCAYRRWASNLPDIFASPKFRHRLIHRGMAIRHQRHQDQLPRSPGEWKVISWVEWRHGKFSVSAHRIYEISMGFMAKKCGLMGFDIFSTYFQTSSYDDPVGKRCFYMKRYKRSVAKIMRFQTHTLCKGYFRISRFETTQ